MLAALLCVVLCSCESEHERVQRQFEEANAAYLADFYHAGQTVQEMKDNIRDCDEKEIGFSFMFPFEVDGKQIFEFVKLLRREGFYY